MNILVTKKIFDLSLILHNGFKQNRVLPTLINAYYNNLLLCICLNKMYCVIVNIILIQFNFKIMLYLIM